MRAKLRAVLYRYEVIKMCGRFVQYRGVADYLKVLGTDRLVVSGYDNHPLARYNVAPSTQVNILYNQQDDLRIDPVRWGWAPFWAKGKRPDPINARVETVTTGKFFKQLWPDSRALVMADGWYEWVKDPDDPKKKQPFFIRLKSQAPMFFAALAEVHSGLEPHEGDGFGEQGAVFADKARHAGLGNAGDQGNHQRQGQGTVEPDQFWPTGIRVLRDADLDRKSVV